MRSTWRWRCCGWFRIGGSRRVLRARDLRDGVPRAGRHLFTERLLEQHHEDRPLGGRHIGTEHFPFCHEENTCAIPLDGQPELRRRSIAKLRLPIERDGARILFMTEREVFSAYMPTPKGPVFMVLLEKAFGKEVTTRTWDTVAKVTRA